MLLDRLYGMSAISQKINQRSSHPPSNDPNNNSGGAPAYPAEPMRFDELQEGDRLGSSSLSRTSSVEKNTPSERSAKPSNSQRSPVLRSHPHPVARRCAHAA
jgi:hypothetical protein